VDGAHGPSLPHLPVFVKGTSPKAWYFKAFGEVVSVAFCQRRIKAATFGRLLRMDD
jgi:hypothetical protein